MQEYTQTYTLGYEYTSNALQTALHLLLVLLTLCKYKVGGTTKKHPPVLQKAGGAWGGMGVWGGIDTYTDIYSILVAGSVFTLTHLAAKDNF